MFFESWKVPNFVKITFKINLEKVCFHLKVILITFEEFGKCPNHYEKYQFFANLKSLDAVSKLWFEEQIL
jgi:hypothetical protein